MLEASIDMGHIGDMSRWPATEERRGRSKYQYGTYRGHEQVASEGRKTGKDLKWKGILRGSGDTKHVESYKKPC